MNPSEIFTSAETAQKYFFLKGGRGSGKTWISKMIQERNGMENIEELRQAVINLTEAITNHETRITKLEKQEGVIKNALDALYPSKDTNNGQA